MKTLYFKTAVLLSFLYSVPLLEAQTQKKDFHTEFTATTSSELLIVNQFGNITVTDWDQNKVVIDVIAEVTASDDSKTQKLLNNINIDFKEEGSTISAKTRFGDDGILKIKNKGEKQTFRIDYSVKCPKSIRLKLDNQFGDMIISSFTGAFSANLKFGTLNAVSLTGNETSIDSQFSKLTIGTMNDGKIDIQHCEVVKISGCRSLALVAQFGKVEIGRAEILKANLNHCDVAVDEATESLKLVVNMGNTKIGNVAAGFKSIEIDQNMGDLNIGIDPKAGYTLTAEINMGSIKVPEGLKVTKEKEPHVPGVSTEKISGTYGNGNSTVAIDSNMGAVKIR